jgi:cyclopropane fatty-acyl-phospholipid synthase-like methyltransferase
MNFLRKLFFHVAYLKNPPWDTNQTPPEVLAFINGKSPGRALDLGCGTGTNVITLVQHGWQATGVDYIPKAIHTARIKAKKLSINADFHLSDVTRLDGINGQYDLILDIGCYQSLSRGKKTIYHQVIRDRLAPGGYYMIYLFFQPENSISNMGATEEDLDPFLDFMVQISRTDGTERGIRKSSWLIYQNLI